MSASWGSRCVQSVTWQPAGSGKAHRRAPAEDRILYTFVKRESVKRFGWEFLDRAASDAVAQQASISPVY
jgi:hypothetical protein